MRAEIVSYIRKNRVSTTEIADALGKAGVLPGVFPVNQGMHKVGVIRTFFVANGSNYFLHEELPTLKENEVAVVFAHACDDRAIAGDLISRYALLYLGAEGLVINGLVRDVDRLVRESYPVWSMGVTPLGCVNDPNGEYPEEEERDIRDKYQGGVAVCDGGGVVVIPPENLNIEMMERIKRIELQEDVWSYCLNSLKWDTKRIVCDKEYLESEECMPPNLITSLGNLKKTFSSCDTDTEQGRE